LRGLDDGRRKATRDREAKTGEPPEDWTSAVAEFRYKHPPEEAPSESKPPPEGAPSGAPKAGESPRLREPKHHRVVRAGAGTRRRAITAAGAMLLVASALGAYTAVGVFGQLGANPPAAIPGTPMTIQGPISDTADNSPLEGVEVVIVGTSNENVSNADGWYFLAAVAPGTYTLEASKPGFTTVRKTINVSPGIPRVEGFGMKRGGGTQDFAPEPVGHYSDPRAPELALALAILLSSILCAVGGWSAVTHRHYLTAVAGAAGGTATVGLIGGIPLGSLLAVAALAVLASLKTGFLEAQTHRIPWERRSPHNRRGGRRRR
jgi:hypothetical protein